MQKWIHCFQDVTTVIFVADIANYDQILFDDESYTRFTETLVLFESVVNSRWFQRNSVMLFLNNVQEFRGKLGSSPLANYFPDYSGGSDYAKAADYVLKLFMSKVTRRPNTNIYPHFTQSSDLALMRLVFSAVVDIIVSENLAARVRCGNL
jgi:guanine nucleotide-binding protein subunit alpha